MRLERALWREEVVFIPIAAQRVTVPGGVQRLPQPELHQPYAPRIMLFVAAARALCPRITQPTAARRESSQVKSQQAALRDRRQGGIGRGPRRAVLRQRAAALSGLPDTVSPTPCWASNVVRRPADVVSPRRDLGESVKSQHEVHAKYGGSCPV